MSRIPPWQNPRAGFGLFATFEFTRVALPLKGVECEFSVAGGVVEVSMSQIFRQENPQPLDCRYIFPLSADASVYACEADINGRIIRAEIKPLKEARLLVEEKKGDGFRTALMESVRDNLFELALGNVQPNDLVIVRLKYFQTLRNIGQTRSLEIPLCPGIRYIPGRPLVRSNAGKGVVDDTDQVPDASRITPVRIDAEHPDAAHIDIQGCLEAEYANPESLISSSHAIEAKQTNGQWRIALSSKGEVPDRDFVLRWDEIKPESVARRSWLLQKGSDNYALLEIRAPHDILARETALDFYFLLDRSGSMAGPKWDKAVEALHSCVKVLGVNDRVMVTLFESNFQDFAEQPLPVQALLEDPQFQNLKKLGASGGTELAPALKHVLEVAFLKSPGRQKNLILITDAQIGNEAMILSIMKTVPDMAVHCFGVDIVLNDALLLSLTRQQGGTFHSLNPSDSISEVVTKLSKTLRRPVLVDLRLSAGWEPADATIPNLYAGQILYLSVKSSAALPLELAARTPAGESVSFTFQVQSGSGEAPRLLWSKTRIQRLLSEKQDAEAVRLSVASNLICRLTAFIAWDESEKVAISRHELVQPAMALGAGSGVKFSICHTAMTNGFSDPYFGEGRPGTFTGATASVELPSEIVLIETEHELTAICQKLPGNDWQIPYQALIKWLHQAGTAEFAGVEPELHQLILRLKLCIDLIVVLESDENRLMQQLRAWRQRFTMLLQRREFGGKWAGLEASFREVESFTLSTSPRQPPQQLANLKTKAQRAPVELLKQFTNHLPALNQHQGG